MLHDWVARLNGLERMGLYAAPDHARITPYQIPEQTELVEVITGGEVFFEVDGQDRVFGEGTIFWHQAEDYTVYRTTPGKPYRCVVFVFSVRDQPRPVPRVSIWNAEANMDVHRFSAECLSLFHAETLNREVLSLYIYSTLLRHAAAEGTVANWRNLPETLQRALTHVHDNLGQRITIADLARHVGISQAQLFRLFGTHLDVTPHHYIMSQQILQARTMLAGTSLPIKMIAFRCGFASLEVFYRRFRGESGMSPGTYRQKYLIMCNVPAQHTWAKKLCDNDGPIDTNEHE